MTALSKATLKATWVANFKPMQGDFANLIDSWTDYHASLEAAGALIDAGATGVAAFNSSTSAVFLHLGSIALASAVGVLPIVSTSTPLLGTPNTQVQFAAVSSAAMQGLNLFNFGGSSGTGTANNLRLATYRGSASLLVGNILSFEALNGSYSAPSALPANSNAGIITYRMAMTSGNTLALGSIIGRSIATATAAGQDFEIRFCVKPDGGADSGNGTQMRVRNGHIVFEPQSVTAASPGEGSVYYDSVLKKLRCWNGTTWNDLF